MGSTHPYQVPEEEKAPTDSFDVFPFPFVHSRLTASVFPPFHDSGAGCSGLPT